MAFIFDRRFFSMLKLLALGLLLPSGILTADVKLPAIFSDHMVLEARDNVPLWGKAAPGEEVTVSMNGQTVNATAGDDGKWKVLLNLKGSKPGPFEMTVSGKNTLKISDVVVGEVWLASGQSNMGWKLNMGEFETVGGPEEVARSANPMIRTFEVGGAIVEHPQDDCVGSWVVAGPETSGKFSAVGYYFAKKLQKELKVPVGFINASVGGTEAEPWTSQQSQDTDPEVQAAKQRIWQAFADYPAQKEKFLAEFPAWLQVHDRTDKPTTDPQAYAAPGISTADWTTVQLPGPITGAGLSADGAIWLRREVTTPENLLAPLRAHNSDFGVGLAPMEGIASVYWNGQLISPPKADFGTMGYAQNFAVPIKQVKVGPNTLAIRVYSPVAPFNFPVSPAVYSGQNGPWLAKAEYALPPLDAATLASAPRYPTPLYPAQQAPGFIFNGMINPLVPYGITGVIWYQGESSIPRGYQYRHAFRILIEDWRQHWENPNLPFYFCQIANWGNVTTDPGAPSATAELRESQGTALAIPRTGEVVTIDIGEPGNVHFHRKREAGERLALIALANTYGEKIPFSGPAYSSMKIEDGKIRLQFDHADGGLVAQPLPDTYLVDSVSNTTAPMIRNSPKSELQGFAICGEDQKWVWADAKIDGNSVLVGSDHVPKPVAVRYAWADSSLCNLYNGAGLPASPFRTDDFPVSTQDKKLSFP